MVSPHIRCIDQSINKTPESTLLVVMDLPEERESFRSRYHALSRRFLTEQGHRETKTNKADRPFGHWKSADQDWTHGDCSPTHGPPP